MKGVWGTDGRNDLERLKVGCVYTAITGHINCLLSEKAIGAESIARNSRRGVKSCRHLRMARKRASSKEKALCL